MMQTHMHIINKYSKDYKDAGVRYMNSSINDIYMAEITIDHITGKVGC